MTEPNFTIPFALGTVAFLSGVTCDMERVPCEECAGEKAIYMRLGNGEEYALDCRACSKGYDPPSGFMEVRTWRKNVETFSCRRVTGMSDRGVDYSESPPNATCYTSASSKDLYATREEAEVASDVILSERLEEEECRRISNILMGRKDMAWSVHYWRRQAREAKKNFEAATARIDLIKLKARG